MEPFKELFDELSDSLRIFITGDILMNHVEARCYHLHGGFGRLLPVAIIGLHHLAPPLAGHDQARTRDRSKEGD